LILNEVVINFVLWWLAPPRNPADPTELGCGAEHEFGTSVRVRRIGGRGRRTRHAHAAV